MDKPTVTITLSRDLADRIVSDTHVVGLRETIADLILEARQYPRPSGDVPKGDAPRSTGTDDNSDNDPGPDHSRCAPNCINTYSHNRGYSSRIHTLDCPSFSAYPGGIERLG
jgi:hypothetical protein